MVGSLHEKYSFIVLFRDFIFNFYITDKTLIFIITPKAYLFLCLELVFTFIISEPFTNVLFWLKI